ncbi:unnamed protein product, partial [Symbiodinium sp. KB8]
DEPCGRTVPEATLKAIAWVEQVAEFPLEQRASHGRLAWAAKDRIVEELSTGAKLTKRAPRYPVYMVAQLERVVMDMGQAVGLRSDGRLERKMAGYADAMVATAALLTAMGLPGVVQGFWTEHSERAILPTALSLQDVAPQDKDLLGRWRPEGSDTYARAFGGRVARLQAQFARAARRPDRYEVLDERDIAATLEHWLEQRGVLNDSQIAELVGAIAGDMA